MERVPNSADSSRRLPSEGFAPRVVREAPMDWVKFDAQLARDGSVDPVDKALYAALASFVDAEARDSDPDPDGVNVPDRKTLAACIGRSVDTVDRATRRLEDRGLVRVERRRDPDNPRSHLPSVYVLLDHELWDERAAARAQARAEARKTGVTKSRGGRMDAARGSRTSAARGGRMDAARGSRTSAAVPLSSKKREKETSSSSVVTQTTDRAHGRVQEEEGTAAPKDEHEGQEHESGPLDEAADVVDAATARWDGHRLPTSSERLRLMERVAYALTHGGSREGAYDALTRDLEPSRTRSAVAVVMSRTAQAGWAESPGVGEGAAAARPELPPRCGHCDESRMVETEDGRVRRCPACHPLADRSREVPPPRDGDVVVLDVIELDDVNEGQAASHG